MGGGTWTSNSYDSYTKITRGMSSASFSTSTMGAQEVFQQKHLHPDLNPKHVLRECVDTEEHPNTLPVILALDVTGSMGAAAAKVAKALGTIMEDLYASKDVQDIEFCIMAIGDLYCDRAPIQMSQFESDVRIAEHLDKVWFEYGGGGNSWESYTAAWYMGARHCKLDCWNRGKRGIIITMGDEQINPELNARELSASVGDSLQDHVKTKGLYAEASEKFDIYHISVNDTESSYTFNNGTTGRVDSTWTDVLGQHYIVSTINNLATTITDIIKSCAAGTPGATGTDSDYGISW